MKHTTRDTMRETPIALYIYVVLVIYTGARDSKKKTQEKRNLVLNRFCCKKFIFMKEIVQKGIRWIKGLSVNQTEWIKVLVRTEGKDCFNSYNGK